MKNKILVTGGAGYIGSHTIVELVSQWPGEIISVDNFSNSSPDVFDRIEKITKKKIRNYNLNLCDIKSLEFIFNSEPEIKGVIHFAAYKSVPESVTDPDMYYFNNINSLINVLQMCSKHGVENFIFSSSCSVYGDSNLSPVTENTPLGYAKSPYAYTKQIGERIISDHVYSDPRMRAISLRYFNPVGAHMSGLIGEDPVVDPSGLVPIITRTATGRLPFMYINGLDYDTRDGSCIRDYVHVSDISDAHISALNRTFSGLMRSRHEIVNLGTGSGVSVLEAISAFESISGLKINYKIGPRRNGDVGAIWSDTTLSKELLGWEARRTLLDMMSSSWLWEKNCNQSK